MKINKYDISVLIAGIRTHNWQEVFDSLKSACTKYTFEVVFVGPFDPPESLQKEKNIKFIKDYGQPSRCVQRGLLECEGKLLFQTVDDCNFLNNSLDLAIDLYNNSCSEKDIVNGRYFEGGDQMPLVYWIAHHHPSLRLPKIHPEWRIALQPIIDTEYVKSIGGWDCNYEYCNAGQHDFVFRVQSDGGKIFNSPTEICNADHMPMYSGDHEPIERLWEENDFPLLKQMYGEHSPKRQVIIDINNWQRAPEVWRRRFKAENLPKSYQEMYPNISVENRWKRRGN